MLKLVIVLFLLTVIASADQRKNIFHPRIIGGENASIKDFPYQVSLQYDGINYCGGAIISKKWVISSLFCYRMTPLNYTIRSGSTWYTYGGSLHVISRVIGHEKFLITDLRVPRNDIVLIEVNPPFEFDETRQPLKLNDQKIEPDKMAIVAGWGFDGTEYPETLKSVKVPIVDKKICNENYSIMGGVPEGQICAGLMEGGRDSCAGDNGSPLVVDAKMIGIVSWGRQCAEPGFPGVYTEISAYNFWIQDKLKNYF